MNDTLSILEAAEMVEQLKGAIVSIWDMGADEATGEYHLCCQAINSLDNAVHQLRQAQLIRGDRDLTS